MSDKRLQAVVDHTRRLVAADATLADYDLLERFVANRDSEAFTTLVQRHAGLVLGECQRVLKQRQDAEDASQATFLVLARRSASIRQRTALASWLYGVAYRLARRWQETMPPRRTR